MNKMTENEAILIAKEIINELLFVNWLEYKGDFIVNNVIEKMKEAIKREVTKDLSNKAKIKSLKDEIIKFYLKKINLDIIKANKGIYKPENISDLIKVKYEFSKIESLEWLKEIIEEEWIAYFKIVEDYLKKYYRIKMIYETVNIKTEEGEFKTYFIIKNNIILNLIN